MFKSKEEIAINAMLKHLEILVMLDKQYNSSQWKEHIHHVSRTLLEIEVCMIEGREINEWERVRLYGVQKRTS